MPHSIHEFTVKDIRRQPVKLEQFKGKVLVIVNTASACGFTPQYDGLEALYAKHRAEGLEVLGFPCNQFGGQEPGTEEQIAEFCQMRKVSFPMFAKIDVNGPNADPLFDHLKSEAKGLLGTEGIKWNFTKFLVDRQGVVLERFAPNTEPAAMEKAVTKALKS